MEERTQYVAPQKPPTCQKLIRLPVSLRNWYAQHAKEQRRSANAEMVLALEFWRRNIELYRK